MEADGDLTKENEVACSLSWKQVEQIQDRGQVAGNEVATPGGFEPPISTVTGWHVRPLHHGAVEFIFARKIRVFTPVLNLSVAKVVCCVKLANWAVAGGGEPAGMHSLMRHCRYLPFVV